MNRKKRSIYCTVERLSYLSKHKLISNKESVSKVKKVREIINEQRDNKQSVNKDTVLNVPTKYLSIINRRDANFINEIDFN